VYKRQRLGAGLPQLPGSAAPRSGSQDAAAADPDPWTRTLAALGDAVSPSARARWLEPCDAVADGSVLRVLTDSPFRAAYVTRTYGDALQRAARTVGFERVDVASST
jgi:hypothetical protein